MAKTYRARLKHGGHSGGELVLPNGELVKEPPGGFNVGDVIQAETDLAARFPEKFEPVEYHGKSGEFEGSRENEDAEEEDGLEALTKDQLQELGESEEIDVDRDTMTKQEMIDYIRRTRRGE